MAVTTTGYYGLGTTRRDFGMKTNMTLPVVSAPDPPDEPRRGRAGKKFKPGKEPPSKPSWKKRLSGIFRRSKVYEEVRDAPPKEAKSKESTSSEEEPSDINLSLEQSNEQPVPEPTEEGTGPIILTVKPSSGTDKKSRYVTLQPIKGESLGIYLSGGGPPITITHVEPGGAAEKAGLNVGDTVLEVNGHDCRKDTDILKITELKALVQQASVDSDEELDEEAWAYIKAKQGELEKEPEMQATPSETQATPTETQATPTETQATPTESQATSTESHEEPPAAKAVHESPPKAKTKKKQVAKELSTQEGEAKPEKKKKAPVQEQSPEEPAAAAPTGGKKKKKVVKKEKEAKAAVAPPQSSAADEPTKKKKKKVAAATKSEAVEVKQPASPAAADTKPKKKQKSKAKEAEVTSEAKAQVESSQNAAEEKKGIKKKKKKAVAAPEAGEEQVDSPPAQQDVVPEKVTIAVIKPKEKSKKRKDSGSQGLSPRAELYKVKDEPLEEKPAEKQPKKKKKTKAKPRDATLEKTDDLVFVNPQAEDTTKPPSAEVKRKKPKSSTSSLRRNSEQVGTDMIDFAPITSGHRSTSYTEDLNKEQKKFRGELRQTSKSQYDMANNLASPDEKLVMKKSGVVMKKRDGGSRPSIFDHSSSPEPEEEEERKAEKKEKGKKKKEDVVTPPPTTDATTPGKATKSKEKPVKKKKETKEKKGTKEKKMTSEMSFSSIPVTPPSLGLAHGHDKLDLINRSSSMSGRRPKSLRKTPSTEEERMGLKRVELGSSIEEKPQSPLAAQSPSSPISPVSEGSEVDRDNDDGTGGNLLLSAHKKQVMSGYTSRSGQRRSSADIAKAAVSAVQQKQERQKESLPIARSLFPEEPPQQNTSDYPPIVATNLSSKFSQESTESGAQNPQQSRLGRKKSVDIPTKTLELVGMFSESQPTTPPSSQNESPSNSLNSSGRRTKSVEKPVKTLGFASEQSSQPPWVAIAQGKSKRASGTFDESPTKPQPPQLPASSPPPAAAQPQKTTSSPPPPQTTTTTEGYKQASLPKAGTVRARMALFQQGK